MEHPLGLINEKSDILDIENICLFTGRKKTQIFLNFSGEGKKCSYRQSMHRQLIVCRNKQKITKPPNE